MTDATFDGVVARATVAKRPGWLARLRQRLADWIATEDPEADPTAAFSSREWADLPTHHPAEGR